MMACYFRDPKYFDNGNNFDPFRWLDGRVDATCAKIGMSLTEFFTPFHTNQHVCLGKQLAELEARVIVARWVIKYDITFVGKVPPKQMVCVFVLC
jgi:cytochrome P450